MVKGVRSVIPVKFITQATDKENQAVKPRKIVVSRCAKRKVRIESMAS